MPIKLTIEIADEDVAKFLNLVKSGDTSGNPPATATTDPAPVSDGKRGRKAANKEQAAEQQPAADPPAQEQAPNTADLVTQEQMEISAETAKAAEPDDMRAQLTDYYTGQGSSKKDVQNALSAMSDDELREAYHDYLARLVVDEAKDFTADFTTPYLAVRIDNGKEAKRWVKGGVTLTDEEVKEAKLADPNAKAETAKKPGLPVRRK
jgi:hypothetical protein